MNFWARLVLVVATLWLCGCHDLSRRTTSDSEIPLTQATVEALAGDYQVMVPGLKTFHPPSSKYWLISDLEDAGKKMGPIPAVLSLRFSSGKIHLNLKAQGKESLQIFDYKIVGNEVHLDHEHDGLNAIIMESDINLAAGFGRFKDGRLWMRCRSTGFVLLLLVIPIIVDEESTVTFAPVQLSEDFPASD